MANFKTKPPLIPAPPQEPPSLTQGSTPTSPVKLRLNLSALLAKPPIRLTLAILSLGLIGLILALMLISRTKKQLGFTQPPISPPSPSPVKPTSWFNHPQVLEVSLQVASLSAQLNHLEITNHPLLPPILDMEVKLEE